MGRHVIDVACEMFCGLVSGPALVMMELEEGTDEKPRRRLARRLNGITQTDVLKCLIVFGSFVVYFIADGVSLTFGIFTRELIDHFGKSNSQTFITTGLIQSVPLFMSPFVCKLIEKFSCRAVALAGSSLLAVSFISARYFVNNLLTLNLTIGIMTSLGLAMLYISGYLIISFNFNERRALATGIAVSGSGLGIMVLSPLSEYLIQEYGWMDTCLIFGAISSHTFISACLFRKVGEDQKTDETNAGGSNADQLQSSKARKHKHLGRIFPQRCLGFLDELVAIYKNKRFIIVNISYFFLSSAIATPHNFLPSHIKLLEGVEDPSSIAISLLGISTLIGQIVVGVLSDIYRPYDWLIYVICILITGVSTCLVPFLKNLYLIYIYAAVFGFASSVNYVLQSSLVIESLGLVNLTLAFGWLQMMQGFSTLFVTPLLGLVKDKTQNYEYTFFVGGFILILAGLMLIWWPFLKTSKEPESSPPVAEDEEIEMKQRG